MSFHHIPVLLAECIDGLAIRPDGIYLDGTAGGAGHSKEIAARLTTGRLIALDQDPDAVAAASQRLEGLPVTVVQSNFRYADRALAQLGVDGLDGVLLDLGVSSHQLDEVSRGFSYQGDAPLDMRMDASQPFSARELVNEWPEKDIARVIREYGEENWAAQIARVLCDRRKLAPIETTAQLVDVIDAAIPKKVRARDGSHPARRTFQALRIAVNDELKPLEQALDDFASLLKPGGRLCVIAFHSLEDRVVKTTFHRLAHPCTCPPSFPVCVCGKKPTVTLITRKPITASDGELEENPRARSATLRIAEGV